MYILYKVNLRELKFSLALDVLMKNFRMKTFFDK